jgi:hypothetical protein
LLQYDGGSMVIRSWYMPHSSMPFTTTSLPASNQHLPWYGKYIFPSKLFRILKKIITKLGNMNDILKNAYLILAINSCFEDCRLCLGRIVSFL